MKEYEPADGGIPIRKKDLPIDENDVSLKAKLEWFKDCLWVDSLQSLLVLPDDWLYLFFNIELNENKESVFCEKCDKATISAWKEQKAEQLKGKKRKSEGDFSSVRLMNGFLPPKDQHQRGACAAFAMVALCEYLQTTPEKVPLSEQFLYWASKQVSETAEDDLTEGVMPEQVLRAVEEFGICPESDWPYNSSPSGWNLVEDIKHEGMNQALVRSLTNAKPYRIPSWKTVPAGAISQFKHVLSEKRPIYTGILCFRMLDSKWTNLTGKVFLPLISPEISFSEEFLVKIALEAHQENSEGDILEWDELVNFGKDFCQKEHPDFSFSELFLAKTALKQLREKLGVEIPDWDSLILSGVNEFCPEGAKLAELDSSEGLVTCQFAEVPTERHAICLAGFVDNPSTPGGGYFIFRNSWGEKWAKESPEASGYGLLPYEYMKQYGSCGYAAPKGLVYPAREETKDPFETYVQSHRLQITKRLRDQKGRLHNPGDWVLCPDLSHPGDFISDTLENREVLRLNYKKEQTQKERKQISEMLFPVEPTSGFCNMVEQMKSGSSTFSRLVCKNVEMLHQLGLTNPIDGNFTIDSVKLISDFSEEIENYMMPEDLPEGIEIPSSWRNLVSGGSLAYLFRLNSLPEQKLFKTRHPAEDVYVVVAALTPFHKNREGQLVVPTPVSANDMNTLMQTVERILYKQADPSRKRKIFYSVYSPLSWKADMKRFLSASVPMVLVSPDEKDASVFDFRRTNWVHLFNPDEARLLGTLFPVFGDSFYKEHLSYIQSKFVTKQSLRAEEVLQEMIQKNPQNPTIPLAFIRKLFFKMQEEHPREFAVYEADNGSLGICRASVLGSKSRMERI